jgi:RHS repeat-associated protein
VLGKAGVRRPPTANLAAGQAQSFTYDAVGNRTNATINAASTTYNYPGTSHKLSGLTGATTRSFTYDSAGNVTSSAGISFVYDGRGRMKQAGSTTYLVNGLGQRVKKSGGAETFFAYDEAGHLIGEYDGTGAAIEETIWLGDIPVAVLKPNGAGGVTAYYIWSDQLNTPRLITDVANNVRWEWANNDPFGNNAANENPSGLGTFNYNLRFPGQYYDAETGLHYNYFRDYDPRIGRYVQSDPIGLFGGPSTYSYVRGNPMRRFDPLGLLEYFVFELNAANTSKLQCACGQGYKAFSGNPPYRNDPNATNVQRAGPIPEGWYYIVDRPSGGMNLIEQFRKRDWFALYRKDGFVDDMTEERGVFRQQFRLHPEGPLGSSEGCITLAAGFDRLTDKLKSTEKGVIPNSNIPYYGMVLVYRQSNGW